MTAAQLAAEKEALSIQFQALKEKNLTLNMARGKPSKAQLALSNPLLTILDDPDACFVDGLFSYQLWNKCYRGDFARQAMAHCPDGYFPKAQDLLAFYVLLYFTERVSKGNHIW